MFHFTLLYALIALSARAVTTSAAPTDHEARLQRLRVLIEQVQELREDVADVHGDVQDLVEKQGRDLAEFDRALEESGKGAEPAVTGRAQGEVRAEGREDTQATGQREAFFLGFSATTNDTRSYSPGQTIRFSSVFYDTDSSFNPAAGVYVCPYDGYYTVHGHFFNVFNEEMSFRVYKGATPLITFNIRQQESDSSYCFSCTCNQGETIDIRAFSGSFRVGPDSAFFAVSLLRNERD